MSDQSPAPAPAPAPVTVPATNQQPQPWAPPDTDQEFKFTTIDEAPAWIDKGWASWKDGPALAVPMSDLWGEGPYHTTAARVGDTVKFFKATPSKVAHFEVLAGEPEPGRGTKRPPAVTNASLEDLLKTGYIGVDDLSEDAKGQVLARSPRLKTMIEEGKGVPDPVTLTDMIKLA